MSSNSFVFQYYYFYIMLLVVTQLLLQVFLGTILKDTKDQACRHVFKGMYCEHAGINLY